MKISSKIKSIMIGGTFATAVTISGAYAHDDEFIADDNSAASQAALTRFRASLADNPIPFADPRYAVNKDAFDFNDFVDQVGKNSQLGITKPTEDFFGKGDTAAEYDVIIQSGHFMRARCCGNKTGSAGQYFYEQDYVSYVSKRLSALLTAKGHEVLMIAGDPHSKNQEIGFNSPLRTQIFLAIHLDGATAQCSVSTSLGYDDDSDLLGAHTLGFGIASALGIDYTDFTEDNYTTGLSGYYAFDDMTTGKFEAVLELSELSCPRQEIRLAGATEHIIKNLAAGIEYILEIEEPN